PGARDAPHPAPLPLPRRAGRLRLVVQGAPADAEHPRRTRDIALVVRQRAPHVLALEPPEDVPQRQTRRVLVLAHRAALPHLLRELPDPDRGAPGRQAHRPLELVLQLAHVPGPRILLNEAQHLRLAAALLP